MRLTYPTYPQPIIRQVSSGLNWYLELTNAGVLRAGGTTTDPTTPLNRLKLVDPTGTTAYQIGLNSDAVPTVTATVLSSPKDATYQDLSVWSVNGREWNVRVTSGGSLTITAIDAHWPMLEAQQGAQGHPIPSSTSGVFDGGVWQFIVDAAGVTSMSGPDYPSPFTASTERPSLRSDDDSCSWELACLPTGILYVLGPNHVEDARYHEILLQGPNGTRFPMSVDVNGILYVDTGMQEIDTANQWPIVMQQRSGILYVVDNRFKAPTAGSKGYGRRRN